MSAHKKESDQEEPDQEDDSNPPTAEKERSPYSPYIAGVVLDLSRELGDLNGPSNVTQAHRLWISSGLDEEAFVQALQIAKLALRKAQAHGVANKGAYWFATLRDQLGLNAEDQDHV